MRNLTMKFLINGAFLAAALYLSACGSPAKKSATSNGANSSTTNELNVSPEENINENDSLAPSGEQSENTELKKTETAAVEISNSDLYKKFKQARGAKQTRQVHEAATELLARNPGDQVVLNGLGSLYVEQEKYDLARMVINKVLEKNPGNSTALNNLGVVELKTNNQRLALTDFKKAIESDPTNKFAHMNLGGIYLRYLNYQSAATELQAAVDHGDESLATFNNLGFALTGSDKYAEAKDAYEKALAKDSNNQIVMLNYAALLIEHAGSPEKGLDLIHKIRSLSNEPAILDKAEALTKMARAAKKKESP
jgi:Flp pilus assembly protein TadD